MGMEEYFQGKRMKDDGICRFYELRKGEPVNFSATEALDWAKDIIKELEEGIMENDFSDIANPHFLASGYVKKGVGGKFGDYLMVHGDLELTYRTYCVKSGEPMLTKLDLDIRVCCIDDENKDKFELEDELIIYLEEEEYELFFFDGKKANLGEIIRELILLEKDDYPTL